MSPSAFTRAMAAALETHLGGGMRPRLPAGGDLLWTWFNDLNGRRNWHASGPNPIGFEAIAAYAGLFGLSIEERHVRVLMAMDAVYVDTFHARRSGGASNGARRASGTMTADLFDAMFG